MIKAQLPTSLLGIECLETERLIENPAALRGMEMLKLRGFGISLDDFGTGYSNISYLRRMPLDVIKLDRSLISGLSSDTASRVIARSIISMLKELGYTVLAEGVENEENCDRTGRVWMRSGAGILLFQTAARAGTGQLVTVETPWIVLSVQLRSASSSGA